MVKEDAQISGLITPNKMMSGESPKQFFCASKSLAFLNIFLISHVT